MRHRNSKIVLNKSRAHTGAVVRSLITALVKHGRIKTTAKKAKILCAEIEKLVSRSKKRDQVQAVREADKVFFEKPVAKKFFLEYLPSVKRTSGFTRRFKLGNRDGDNAPMVLVELISDTEPAEPKAAKAEKKETKPAKKAAPKKKPAAKKEEAKAESDKATK